MEIRELRIGNYICDPTEEIKYHKVEEILKGSDQPLISYGFGLIRAGVDFIEPIPLTEEIFVKCGFKNEIDEIDGKMYNIYFVTNTDYLIEYFHSDKKYVFTDDMGLKVGINYLHQLQNLYFSLCGEELEVKL